RTSRSWWKSPLPVTRNAPSDWPTRPARTMPYWTQSRRTACVSSPIRRPRPSFHGGGNGALAKRWHYRRLSGIPEYFPCFRRQQERDERGRLTRRAGSAGNGRCVPDRLAHIDAVGEANDFDVAARGNGGGVVH